MVTLTLKPQIILITVAALLSGCTNLFFYPSPILVRTPADVGLTFERIEISSPQDPSLVGWFLPTSSAPKGTILFLHGNAENISTHLRAVHWLPSAGYQVFLFDYQGYGESEGSANVRHLHNDIVRAIAYLQTRSDIKKDRLFLVGQSLGASAALYTAAQPEFQSLFKAVIAESPFAGYREIARDKLASTWLSYPLQWPLGFLITDEYSPSKIVKDIHSPVLILHGDQDEIVPPEHSKKLCELLQDNCLRWEVNSVAHGGILSHPAYQKRLTNFLDTINR